jgi:hypothetical protein
MGAKEALRLSESGKHSLCDSVGSFLAVKGQEVTGRIE